MRHPELVYALLAAGANVIGAAAVVGRARWPVHLLDGLAAFAGGFMIAAALVGMLPEAIAAGGERAAIVALIGYLLVHLTQHVVGRHFHFGEERHAVTAATSGMALAGLLLHTFFDGVAIASGFRVSEGLGLLVFLAIVLHKCPEGLAISSLFLAAGAGRRRALGAAALLGTATVAGAVLTDLVAPLARDGLALSAGVTVYVAASNLIPDIQRRSTWRSPAAFVAGCALYLVAHGAAPR